MSCGKKFDVALEAASCPPRCPDPSTLAGFLGVALKADRQLVRTPEERAAAVAKFNSIRTRGEARYYLREVMAKVRAERATRNR